MQMLGDGEPRQIGGYRLLGRLGAGGMGDVYLARSDRGRTVAVKLVREELAAQEEFRARFRYEVEAARRVGGHWTAPVLDADTEATVPWVATGYVAGPSLRQVVGHDHGPLPERSVRTLAAGLAHALRDIHGAGLIHRDLKPSNVLITIDGPRVVDFGIARALETMTDGRITRTGALVGSPGFMAPEQVRSDRITPACDIFCLGSVLAYAATGKMPFGTAQTGVHVLMYRIAHEEPNLEGVPAALVNLIRYCLEKEPEARPGLGEVLRRTGAQDTVADGRSHEPWLPGALVAQLGRHAVGLLSTDNPELLEPAPPGDAHPVRALAPETASVAEGVPIPEEAPAPVSPSRLPLQPPEREPRGAGPAPGAAPTHQPTPQTQPPPSHKRGRMTMLIVALVVALSAGGVIYNLTSGSEDDRAGGDPSGPTTSPAGTSPGDRALPEKFEGKWTTELDGNNTRRMNIHPGRVGDTLLYIVARGPKTDGSGDYYCELESSLERVPDSGDSVTFGPAVVVFPEQPIKECEVNEPSTLKVSNNTLHRVVGGGPGTDWKRPS
ncbi:serine/threonine-protein kinase [Streptomyces niveus]|uniref:serine/threonine-protein kinase n=1 Tax=Streptomyces niveus TaxID=193462 RepID=UPI00365DD403